MKISNIANGYLLVKKYSNNSYESGLLVLNSFSNVFVILATGENCSYKPGDVVFISRDAVFTNAKSDSWYFVNSSNVLGLLCEDEKDED